MSDIKLLETCKCGEHLTLMESRCIETDGSMKWSLVKRCLVCGEYPVTEVIEIVHLKRTKYEDA